MNLPDLTYTRAGEAVTSLEPHKGLIRGKVESGAARYWYPDGRLSRGVSGEHDLEMEG